MKTSMKVTLAAALVALTGAASAADVLPYVTSSSNQIVVNSTGLCWRTGFWTPALAEKVADKAGCTCDKDILSAGACAPKAAPVEAPKVSKVSLAADALFNFDKVALKAEGQVALDELVARMAGVNIDLIITTGYADRLGSAAYNKTLSAKRAEAVKAYLVNKGIAAELVQAEGRGAEDPVVNCPDPSKNGQIKNKAQLKDCLAPNRRATVEVIGTRTAK